MKLLLTVLGGMMMIDLLSITPELVAKYSESCDAISLIESLSKEQQIIPEASEEFYSLIKNWKDKEFRKKSLDLLKKDGIDVTRTPKIIVIEWGGGGIPYRALYLAEFAYFIRVSDSEKIQTKKININADMHADINAIIKIISQNNFYGNITGEGADFRTYVVTILDEAKEKTAIIYGASVANIKNKKDRNDNEKDTVSIWDLIMNIKKNCGIKPESGA